MYEQRILGVGVKPTIMQQSVEPPAMTADIGNILEQFANMRENINNVHEVCSMLEQKLESVRDHLPVQEGKPLEQHVHGSELRRALMEQNDRLIALRNRLMNLVSEVDL